MANQEAVRPLIGRTAEFDVMKSFVSQLLKERKAGRLHIWGPSGSGKSLAVKHLRNEFLNSFEFWIEINPRLDLNVDVTDEDQSAIEPNLIYKKILEDMKIEFESVEKNDANRQRIAQELTNDKSDKMIAIVVEDIDLIEEDINLVEDEHVINTIYKWIQLPRSKLILIAIAEKRLPSPLSKDQDQVVNFKAYTGEEMIAIIKDHPQQGLSEKDINDCIGRGEGDVIQTMINLKVRRVENLYP